MQFTNRIFRTSRLPWAVSALLGVSAAWGNFFEGFEQPTPGFTEQGIPGWNSFAGDGQVLFEQRIRDGIATLQVNALHDERNIWYALTHRNVADSLDLEELAREDRELQIEARVRASHAPRRCNLYLAHYPHHDYLREFDLPDTEWHVIRMTTRNWQVQPGEGLLAQVSIMDWGVGDFYRLDVDYVKVEVVNPAVAAPDSPRAVRYRPALADPDSFNTVLPAASSRMVDREFPDRSMDGWTWYANGEAVELLSVDASKVVLVTWDFAGIDPDRIVGEGQFAIRAFGFGRLADSPKDFGEIRICEILDTADPALAAQGYAAFLGKYTEEYRINSQTTVDTKVSSSGETVVTLSNPVLKRLASGQSKGLAIRALGLIDAHFHPAGSPEAPALRIQLKALEDGE
jgi:hypothetical protein